MKITDFISILENIDISFFVGVPDSQLKALCDYLNTETPAKNLTVANEGNAVATAAGYHLATGKTACVYLQNSGLGNIINPVASLLNNRVYGIPVLFVIGWRGEPGIHDEPQHVFQGAITLSLLDVLEIPYVILSKDVDYEEFSSKLASFSNLFKEGKSCAVVVRKGSLTFDDVPYQNDFSLKREEVIHSITAVSNNDIIISTTGKTSRELFEIREHNHESHAYDFLTVGSMGHSSSIALGLAMNRPDKTVWCIDGDGSVLMHMGSLALIGQQSPKNLIHVVINNLAHESVGGMPTAAGSISLVDIAKACGYKSVLSHSDLDGLNETLSKVSDLPKPVLIEVKSAIGSRSDLGRPTTTPVENKEALMNYLQEGML